MPKVRGNPGGKWVQRAQVATEDYRAGAAGAGKDWETATIAATAAQAKGTQDAIARGAFANGVKAAGGQKWEDKVQGIGAQRFAQGVSAGQNDYEKAVAPYLDTIENTKLPPRGAKGDANNINRVIAMNKALRDKKLSIQGGGR